MQPKGITGSGCQTSLEVSAPAVNLGPRCREDERGEEGGALVFAIRRV